MIIGGLIFFYGESIQIFISDQFELITLVTSVALVLGLAGLFVFVRIRKSRRTATSQSLLK